MNTGNRFVVLSSMTVALLLLAACAGAQPAATEPPAPTNTSPPPPEAATGITVTFEGDQCAYHGPERVPAGRIPLTLDVRDLPARHTYAVAAYTLEEGKTIEDLRAWTSANSSPLWGHFHGRVDATGGMAQETTIILFEGPFFLSCVTNPPDQVTDVLGPIEIEPAGSEVKALVDQAAINTDTPLPTDTPIPTETPPPPAETPEPQPEDRTWPTERESFAMAYHAQLDRVLLFCGYDVFVGGGAGSMRWT